MRDVDSIPGGARGGSAAPWPRVSLALCAALLLSLVTVACGSSRSLQVASASLSVPVDAIVVAPFEVRYPAEPWASYLRTVEEVNAAVKMGDYPVYAYGDFAAFQREGRDLYAGRSALALVSEAGLDPNRVALLRGRGKTSSLGQHQAGANRPADSDVEIVLEVEVLHLGTRTAIAQGRRVVLVSPLDRTGDGDPYPRLTEAHRALSQEVLAAAMARVPGDPTSPLPFTLLEPHPRIFSVATDDGPSLNARIAKMDALDQDSEMLKVYGWFYKDIGADAAAALMNAARFGEPKQGLYVAKSQLKGVRAGEWIVSADGQPMEGVHQLHRIWYTAFPGTSIELSVQGEDGIRAVRLEKPEE